MRTLKMVEAIDEALSEEMDRDERVLVYGEDVGVLGGPFGATVQSAKKYFDLDPLKSRVLDTPISETAIVGAAVGAAMAGLRPVAEVFYMDFITCAMDEIVNQLAKTRYMLGGQVKLPVVIRTVCGAGARGAAQHTQSLEAWFLHVPGLKIALPSNPADAKGLLKAAIRDDDPVIVVEQQALYGHTGPVPQGDHLVPLGKAALRREGNDVTIVATMLMVEKALAAAEVLAAEGISVEVIDPRTIFPLDRETILSSVGKTQRLIVAEQSVGRAGFSAELIATIAEEAYDTLKAPPQRVTALTTPTPYSRPLEEYCQPSEGDLIKAVRKAMEGKDPA